MTLFLLNVIIITKERIFLFFIFFKERILKHNYFPIVTRLIIYLDKFVMSGFSLINPLLSLTLIYNYFYR